MITSPTGSVIHDIINRISDRFKTHLDLWPVAVQGQGSAEQIANAIDKFNEFTNETNIKKPGITHNNIDA